MDETKQAGMGKKTMNGRVCGGSLSDGGEGGTAKDITDPQWYVEPYTNRWGICSTSFVFRAVAVDGSSPYIYDRRRVCHDACVGARQRQLGMFERNRAILLARKSLLDKPFARSQGEISYYQELKLVVKNVGVANIPTRLDLAL